MEKRRRNPLPLWLPGSVSRYRLAIAVVISGLLIAQAGAVDQNEGFSAVVFIDSAKAKQQSMVVDINQALYYSSTLRSQLQVTVIDVNPKGRAFNGAVEYSFDSSGEWVAKYLPGGLPYLVCLQGDKTIRRQGLYQASEIRECTKKG